jgi:hypothetical protein
MLFLSREFVYINAVYIVSLYSYNAKGLLFGGILVVCNKQIYIVHRGNYVEFLAIILIISYLLVNSSFYNIV